MPSTSRREPASPPSQTFTRGDAVPAPSEIRVAPSAPSGRTLYVDSEEAALCNKQKRLAVRHPADGEMLRAHPPRDLDAALLVGQSTSCTTPALRLCTRRGVTVARLSVQGTLLGYLTSPRPGRVDVRRAQFFASTTAAEARPVAQSLVEAALQNRHRRLRRRVCPSSPPPLQSAVRRLEALQQKRSQVRTRAALRRLNEAAAQAYFTAWPALLRRNEPAFQIEGQSWRHTGGPVSALLDFTGALLRKDVRAACRAAGLDPDRGLLHEPGGEVPALVRDLMGPFRPALVHEVALALLNRGALDPAHFETSGDEPCLTRAGRAAVYEVYGRRREQPVTPPGREATVPCGRAVELQARRLARALTRREIDFTASRL